MPYVNSTREATAGVQAQDENLDSDSDLRQSIVTRALHAWDMGMGKAVSICTSDMAITLYFWLIESEPL